MTNTNNTSVGRTVILSDTHLGRPYAAAVSAEALRPLWQGADRLIVNGDVAEVHHPDHWSTAARQTLHLHDLCEEDGVALTLLSGNHDPYISDVRHLYLRGRAVFLTHGDALHPAIAPWSPMAGRIRAAYEQAMANVDEDDRDQLEQRLGASQHAAAHIELQKLSHEAGRSTIPGMLLRPWAVVRVLWYWHMFPQLAARFAAKHAPQARFIVLGHTHRPGVWRINDRVIINTGSFGFPGTPRAVVLEAGRLTVWRIALRNGAYCMSEKPLATFENLPDDDDAHQHGAASTAIRAEHPAWQRATEKA